MSTNSKIDQSALSSSPLSAAKGCCQKGKREGNILIALGIIFFIGSLVASGYFFPRIGISSLTFIGGGLLISGGLFLWGIHHKVQEKKEFPSTTNVPIQANVQIQAKVPDRAEVFKETVRAYQEGYVKNGKVIPIDNKPMLANTLSYGKLDKLDGPFQSYKTQFSVEVDDTLNVLLKLSRIGVKAVGLNMANRFTPGGGVKHGARAQEEALCRRSNHFAGLETEVYPFNEIGGIYCPHVQVFREDEAHLFSFMDLPEEVSLIAVAAYNINPGSRDRQDLGLPREGILNKDTLRNCALFVENTKEKMRNMLRQAFLKGHTQLVLGALGCGAFRNPPELISELFHEVFCEDEFKGRFEKIIFAILNARESDQANVDSFSTLCLKLNT